jgi:type I restriction enzyme, S subunit
VVVERAPNQTEAWWKPNGWALSSVGDIFTFEGGSQPDKTHFSPVPKPGYVRLIQIRDYKTDRFETYIPEGLARRFCRSDEIMIGRYGPPIFQILTGLDGAYNVALIKATPSAQVNRKFAYYFLKQERLFNFVEKLSQRSSGQTGVDLKELREYPFPIPPTLGEQEAIANVLSDADAYIESLEKLIAKKRLIKKGVMQELLTGKRRLTGFNKNWDSVRIGDLLTFKNGLNKAKEFFGYGTPIVNYMDVFKSPRIYSKRIDGRVFLTREEISNYDVKRGDVFFTRTSETPDEIGIASVVLDTPIDTVFSGFILRGRPKNSRLVDEFKAYCFSSQAVREQIVSRASYTTRALTNGRILSEVILKIPPQEEQVAIAEALSAIDSDILTLESKISKAYRLKQGMMQELLTGRIRLV